ncbi:hypothetical protein HYS30_01910 [Candidatus Peregrinibacteria bacterium]|nr:hypothetical protein [Candidatus Peregrinibacteria bacterium]
MDKLEKFLRILAPKRRRRALTILRALQEHDLRGLDIRPLKGKKGHCRCRMGDVRFLFVRINGQTNVYDADFRGNSYKK